MKRGYCVKILFFLVTLLALFSVFLLVSSIILFRREGLEDENFSKHGFYKYLVVDSVTQTSKSGVLSLAEDIGEDSIHLEPSSGVHVLLSNFGDESEEYVCTGSCYCSSNDNVNRRSSLSVHRGLIYLVSAASSILAIHKASQYYEKECRLGLEDECRHDLIFSEVDDCEPVVGESDKVVDDDESYEGGFQEEERDPDYTEFKCSGHCIRSDVVSGSVTERLSECEWEEEEVLKRYERCVEESMKGLSPQSVRNVWTDFSKGVSEGEARIDVFCDSLELNTQVSILRGVAIPFSLQEERANDVFTTVHLHKFCKANSIYSRDEYKKEFLSFETELAEDIFDKQMDIFSVMESESSAICEARRSSFYIPKEIGRTSVQMNNVVCLRQFTDEEWRYKIPYEDENLRHWKEGYKMRPDRLSSGQVELRLKLAMEERGLLWETENESNLEWVESEEESDSE